MRQIDRIDVHGGGKRVELWEGDLTDWPDGVDVDALVVSAFPNEYSPTPRSVIGALDRKGVSVAKLARHKDVDIREHYSCWLSRPLAAVPGVPYRHIVCFEPLARGRAPELVGDIFRALVPMAMIRDGLRTVAMPIVASGDQRNRAEDMLPPLVDAALHWLEVGHPVERVIIVSQSKAKTEMAQKVFADRKATYSKAAPASAADFAYDIFLSYAHKNRGLADALSKALLDARSGLRIFVDRQELDVGMAWQPTLFESLEKSRKVVALLSPDYVKSKACQEEFNIAWIRARRPGARSAARLRLLGIHPGLDAVLAVRGLPRGRRHPPFRGREPGALRA